MAPAWRGLVQRDGPASGSSDEAGHLSTGAIIGIACGAGALFLGSMILFIIYWRKQNRHEAENGYYGTGVEGGHFNASTAAPIYTLDYKGGESVAETPQTSYTAQSGFSSTPLVEMASAMPAHPAYIPRALVRQNGSERGTPSTMSPASGTTSQFSSTSSRQYREKAELNYPSTQTTTIPSSRRDTPDRQPAAQAYEEYESDSVAQAQPRHIHRRRPSVGTGIPGPIPVPVPALTMPTQSSARRKQYSPPRLNLNTQPQQSKYINAAATTQAMPPTISNNSKVPISAVDISGPLAFPPQPAPPPPPPIQLGGPRQQQEHHQQYQKELEIQLQLDQHNNNNYYYEESSSATGPDTHNNQYHPYRGNSGSNGPPQRGRSFRDRSLSSRGGTSRSRSNRGDRSDGGGGGGVGGAIDPYYYSSSNGGGRQGQQYHHHQYQQQQATHYEEVEIGRSSDDDIW